MSDVKQADVGALDSALMQMLTLCVLQMVVLLLLLLLLLLINKMLSEKDRVLIKVIRVEKGYGATRIMNEFTRSGAFCKWVYRCGIRDVDHLKEQLIEEWPNFDHYIIDRAVN